MLAVVPPSDGIVPSGLFRWALYWGLLFCDTVFLLKFLVAWGQVLRWCPFGHLWLGRRWRFWRPGFWRAPIGRLVGAWACIFLGLVKIRWRALHGSRHIPPGASGALVSYLALMHCCKHGFHDCCLFFSITQSYLQYRNGLVEFTPCCSSSFQAQVFSRPSFDISTAPHIPRLIPLLVRLAL